MPDLDRPGRSVSIPFDFGKVAAPRANNHEKFPRRVRVTQGMTARTPSGHWSRSLYIITTDKHLVRRIRPIEEKKDKPHEFRTNDFTVAGRGKCSWDGKTVDDPIHHF
jgi:hypothetical protein